MSGGIAMYPEDGDDWDSLFTAADRRLYRAKSAGRNRVAWSDEDEPYGLPEVGRPVSG